jgi:hypothetical protein
MGMDIQINGVSIKQPKNPSVSHYNLTKSGRLASGKMTMDLVAKKKKLFLEYEVLSGAEVEHILSLIDTDELFFTVSYIENGVARSFKAYVGEINRKLHRGGGNSGWYWTDVAFNFIEQ